MDGSILIIATLVHMRAFIGYKLYSKTSCGLAPQDCLQQWII